MNRRSNSGSVLATSVAIGVGVGTALSVAIGEVAWVSH
jgi:hypothetical protein